MKELLRRFRGTQLMISVKVKLTGRDTEETVVEDKPLHKKNPDVGTKKLVYASEFIMEQEDVASFGDNEEVSYHEYMPVPTSSGRHWISS